MIESKGASLKEYLFAQADEKILEFNNLLTFNHTELEEYKKLLETFHKTNSSKATTKEKGESLEKIVKFVIEKTGMFETYENVQTSSNEIDILARLNSRGKYFKAQGLLDFENTFLSECKNYNKKVDVTWVGKFYTLMKYTTNELGILFSYKGLSGKNWNDATGLIKKLHLYDKDSYIIDFNYKDFLLLSNGVSFLNLIINKKFNIKNDTSITSFLVQHPNQDYFKK